MNVLDLFSGIGGFSLGLERAGMKTVAFCEIDKKARQVLKKHWPDVPIFDDVKTLTKEKLDEQTITVDVICGGFPCQDISLAGQGAGLAGERSGLWFQFHRLIEEIRPSWVIIENVSALRSRGLDQVLRSLSQIGYDAEWHCITASAVGAPHQRDRIWIVAYSNRDGEWAGDGSEQPKGNTAGQRISDSSSLGIKGMVANALRQRLEGQWKISGGISEEQQNISDSCWWAIEPAMGRVAYGIPGRVDRLKQLGNAVVPQIPELIGKAIMAC
jgi:DNA (cytosine-5)-methyltransferase 1